MDRRTFVKKCGAVLATGSALSVLISFWLSKILSNASIHLLIGLVIGMSIFVSAASLALLNI